MLPSTVLRDDADGVATLTLNRPERLNALDTAIIDALMAELERIEIASEIGAVILTGAGEEAFSAGADIHGLRAALRRGADTVMRDFVRRGLAATILSKPRRAVAAALASVTRGLNVSIHEGLAIEAAQFAQMLSTADLAEGVGAFVERRKPAFRGA